MGMAAIGGGVFLFVMLPGVALAGIGFLVLSGSGAAGIGGELLIAAGVAVFAIGAVLASALRQVFAVVLYRWATTGEAPQGFSTEDSARRSAHPGRARHRLMGRERLLLKLLGCLAWPRRLAASAPPRAPLGARASPRTGIRDLARRPAAASAFSMAASAYSSPLAGRRFASVLHLQT